MAARRRLALATATLALAAVDFLAWRGRVGGAWGGLGLVGLHYGAVAGLGLPLAALLRQRPDPALRWGLIALLFGPFAGGALCVLGLGALRPVRAAPGLDPAPVPDEPRAAGLARQIREGRRHPLEGRAPASFAAIFAGTDLEAQQRALAAISRSYRPEMRDALRHALASDVPAIRVQAAAIHAKLRGQFEARAKVLLSQPEASAAERQEVAESGFLPRETVAALESAATATSPPPAKRPYRVGPRTAPPRLKRHSCGGIA